VADDNSEFHDEFGAIDLALTRASPYGTIAEPTYSGVTSFMRRRYTKALDGVDVAVTGVPFDLATTSRPGARLGPRAIRAASTMLAWNAAWGWDTDPFDVLNVIDYGDCVFDPGHPQSISATLEAHFTQLLEAGVATLMLGGDHFCTYPALKAYAKRHGPLALVHFDAHSDTWRACDARLDHGSMFFQALEEGLINRDHSVQVGIRTNNPESHGLRILDADWVNEQPTGVVVDAIRAQVGRAPCYLTFDIDCLDPAFAPGTGTPVVGGLDTGRARRIVRGLRGLNVYGMDIMEVSPPYDVSEITALAAASIALDLLGLYAARDLVA
jgi:agmatinase